jgi:hypothetical protein
LWIPLTFELSTCNKGFLFMFYIFWSFSRPIVAILRFPTEKSLLPTYRYFFKRFWLLHTKEIAKTSSFVFLFQYVDSVLFYILSEYLFFDLSLHQNNFKNIFLQDLIGWPRPANKKIRLSEPCCLFICIVAIFVWRWRELI